MSGSRPPAQYEIRIEGVLGEHWVAWFEGLQVRSEAGETILSGLVLEVAVQQRTSAEETPAAASRPITSNKQIRIRKEQNETLC